MKNKLIKEAIQQAKGGGFPNPWVVDDKVISSDEYRNAAIKIAGIQRELDILQKNEGEDNRKRDQAIDSLEKKINSASNKLLQPFEAAKGKISEYMRNLLAMLDNMAEAVEEDMNDDDAPIAMIDHNMQALVGFMSIIELFHKQVTSSIEESAKQINEKL